MAGVAKHSAVAHNFKIAWGDDLVAPCYVTKKSPIGAASSMVTTWYRPLPLYRLDRVYLGDIHHRATARGRASQPLCRTSRNRDDDVFAGHEQVCGVHNRVPCGLSGAVSVVKKCLQSASFTSIAGNLSAPASARARSRYIPVVVSSVQPMRLSPSSAHSPCSRFVRSPPSVQHKIGLAGKRGLKVAQVLLSSAPAKGQTPQSPCRKALQLRRPESKAGCSRLQKPPLRPP